jgi:hypothetical protein
MANSTKRANEALDADFAELAMDCSLECTGDGWNYQEGGELSLTPHSRHRTRGSDKAVIRTWFVP